jgi:hypothetical protein
MIKLTEIPTSLAAPAGNSFFARQTIVNSLMIAAGSVLLCTSAVAQNTTSTPTSPSQDARIQTYITRDNQDSVVGPEH